jgi:hypothetical protein
LLSEETTHIGVDNKLVVVMWMQRRQNNITVEGEETSHMT